MAVSVASGHGWLRSPSTVIGRFVARRTMRSAVVWAAVFGAYVASKSEGLVKTEPTVHDRALLVVTLGNNTGLNALFGRPHDLLSIAGFTAWNTLVIMTLVGSVWAMLLATKTLRGEEEAGRWELLLTGQTTARLATVNALAGLSMSLLVLFVVTALAFIGIGQLAGIGFSVDASAFFALAAVCGATMFMAVGALASQLMPTRARAAGLAIGVFGVAFLLRAAADTTSATWLLNVTPLGWVERLRPLYNSQPLWLVPIVAFTAVVAGLAVWLAGRRDLGGSLFTEAATAKPRLRLLKSPLGAAWRLNRASSLSWLAVVVAVGAFFGLLTRAAVRIVDQSQGVERVLGSLSHSSSTDGAKAFLGVAFLILLLVVMSQAASAVGRMREDEAQGYLDSILVRSVSRLHWLGGRIGLAAALIVIVSALAGVAVQLGVAGQHLGVSFDVLLLAGLNLVAPAVLVLGIGLFVMGLAPRLTTLVAYGVIAWSFLIEMVSSGINLNHWVLDTSILHHVALAPSADPAWGTAGMLVIIGVILGLIGAVRFNQRDLEPE